ncbi:hypothetical protein [Chlorobaculum sp. 24CR]
MFLFKDFLDSIATSNAELTLSEWQKEKLNWRYKDYQKGNLELHDW